MSNFSKPEKYDKRLYKLTDYEELSKTRLFKYANDYYNSGANDMASLHGQYKVYKNIKLKTSLDVDEKLWKGTKTTILGENIDSPICIAATAF